MKYLVLFLVVAVVLWLMFGLGRKPPPGSAPKRGRRQAEDMVVCAHCGVHLPRGEALFERELPYCSDTHRLAGPQRR